MTHHHRATETLARTFYGCVNPDDCNPEAHGAVCEIHTCECGAVQERNCNGSHEEHGLWREAGEPTGES